MGNLWIRFGCFLTGYNYRILRLSSEVAAKSVKKYTSAIIIVCILWSFIGYTFTSRYLHGGIYGSIAGAVIFVVIIIQIERQIILTHHPGRLLFWARGIIAAMMSLIGAIIIDQIILKEDIELEKVTSISERVNQALIPKTADLRLQINNLDTAIDKKEKERMQYVEDVNKLPVIRSVMSQTAPVVTRNTKKDSLGTTSTSEVIQKSTTITVSNIPNPKQSLIAPLETTIADLRKQKAERESSLLNIRPQVEAEISSKTGFLDELKIMFKLISESNVALGVWLLWFFFLLGLELLVLISKANDKDSDYETTLDHQLVHQNKKLQLLSKLASTGN